MDKFHININIRHHSYGSHASFQVAPGVEFIYIHNRYISTDNVFVRDCILDQSLSRIDILFSHSLTHIHTHSFRLTNFYMELPKG